MRQQALHCSLAAQIQQTLGSQKDPYASNWLERLRQLKRIRAKVIKENETIMTKEQERRLGKPKQPAPNDFTVAVLRRKDPTEQI